LKIQVGEPLRRFGGSFQAKGVLVYQELRCYQGYSQPSQG